MSNKHQYYRGDVRIDEAEALDPRGHIKDGITARVSATMRDAPPPSLWAQADPRGSGSTGFGSSGQLGARPGQPCTRNGWQGTLKRAADGSLVCNIGRRDALPQFRDGGDPTSGNKPGWRIPAVNDRQTVRDAYQSRR
jgi:hypothetical protein